jgi:outer membrane protein
MKKYMIMAMMLLSTMATFAQSKTTAKNDAKWKVRLRVIAAIPPSKSYSLSSTTDVVISTSVVPELDFTYYFMKNFAAELILGTTHHKVSAKSTTKTELGKVWLLPPTLNLQYHFTAGSIEPYIGAGINYTIFYGAKDEAMALKYKNNVGFSTQIGADYNVSKKLFINLDIKKIFLKTDVTIKGPNTVLKNVKVDPFVIGLGVGLRF